MQQRKLAKTAIDDESGAEGGARSGSSCERVFRALPELNL